MYVIHPCKSCLVCKLSIICNNRTVYRQTHDAQLAAGGIQTYTINGIDLETICNTGA